MSLLSERQLRDQLASVEKELDKLRQRVFSDEYIAKLERRSELADEERVFLDTACWLIERKLLAHKQLRFFEGRAA